MRKTLPLLTACAVVLLACASDAPDTMAEMLRDAAAAIDGSGPSDASAQPAPETMELACDKEWTAEQNLDAVKSTTRYAYRVVDGVDYKSVRSAWVCEPRGNPSHCQASQTCTGDVTGDTQCVQTMVSLTRSGDLMVSCGFQSTVAIAGGTTTVTEGRFSKLRLVLD